VRNLLTAIFPLILGSVPDLTQEKRNAAGKVEYSVEDDNDVPYFSDLRATVNGRTYQLIDRSKQMCLQVVDQRDFDGDGFVDALVENILGCGGNCCPNGFFFVSNVGAGRFEVSDEFADSWGDPVIEKWKGRWSVVVTSSIEGIDQQRLCAMTRRFVLESGKPVLVEEWRRKEMESIAEIRSECFDPKKVDETQSIEYDLDGDGKKDQIISKYWSRWGSMMWSIEFADGKKYSSDLGCKRIGVLATKTNRVSDLVCDQDTILRWNGREYEDQAEQDKP
jgi:hypothetical protein